MRAVLEVSLEAQKPNSFLPLHPGVLADNPEANVGLLSSTTIFVLGGFGLGLGMPC